jgi:hypothetical protein
MNRGEWDKIEGGRYKDRVLNDEGPEVKYTCRLSSEAGVIVRKLRQLTPLS